MRSFIFAVAAAAALSAATLFGSVQAAPLATPAAATAQQGGPALVEQVQSRRMERSRMMRRPMMRGRMMRGRPMMRGRMMNRGRMMRSRPMMRGRMMNRGRMMRSGRSRMM